MRNKSWHKNEVQTLCMIGDNLVEDIKENKTLLPYLLNTFI